MSQIMKAFLGIFIILFMAGTMIGIFSIYLTAIRAQNLQAELLCEMENSAYYRDVICEGFRSAEKNGFSLEVTLYEKDGGTQLCCSSAAVPADTTNIHMARVTLGFPLELPLLGIREEYSMTGYAR